MRFDFDDKVSFVLVLISVEEEESIENCESVDVIGVQFVFQQ